MSKEQTPEVITPRLQRRIRRELDWLRRAGIERDHDVPLYPNQKRKGGRFDP